MSAGFEENNTYISNISTQRFYKKILLKSLTVLVDSRTIRMSAIEILSLKSELTFMQMLP